MSGQRLVWTGFAILALLGAGDPPGPSRRADQEALRPFAGLVGAWKGTGQPQRNSARGAWREGAEWDWVLNPESARLRMTVESGKFLRSLKLAPGEAAGEFRAEATLADGDERTYRGRLGSKGSLVLEPADGRDGPFARMTLTPLHETRFLLLLEGAAASGGPATRLAEVGYTRQGVAFAAGDSHPECIVTGGRGTIRVSHKGKEFWVCCSGCKDLFEDDPEAILAEAAERRARP